MFISKFIVLYKMNNFYSEWNLAWLHINPLMNFRSMLTLRLRLFFLIAQSRTSRFTLHWWLYYEFHFLLNHFRCWCCFGPCQLKRCNYGSLMHVLWVLFPVQAFLALLLSRDPVHNNDAQWQHSRCDLKHLQQFWFDPLKNENKYYSMIF